MSKELLAPLIDAIVATGRLDREQALEQLASWEIIEGREHDQHVATAIMKGTEIHFAVQPENRRRLIRRKNTQEFLAPLLARHGFLTTRVLVRQEAEKRFVERIGFVPTWSDGLFQFYMLTRLPFERNAK